MKKKKTARPRKRLPRTQKKSQSHAIEPTEIIPSDVLDKLPDETRIGYIQAQSFKGPLPPPALFEHYEETLSGSAERILKLTEREQTHRHKWETSVLDAQSADVRRGQWLGFAIAATGMVSAVVCAILDKQPVAIASLIPVLGGIVASILNKKSSESD